MTRAKDPLAPSTLKRNARLVYDVMAFVRSYVVLSREQLMVLALWAIHTHCVREFEQTPYITVTSPEKRCGKSRLLETMELLVARPWQATLPSEAVVYRQVSAVLPTLLLDETDTIFNPRTADKYEGLRALLNSGHRRGSKVPRCVGTSMKIVEFSTFCPKMLAGIGTLPETVTDRAVPIRMERKRRDETVGPFKRRQAEPLGEALRDRVEAWVDKRAEVLGMAQPDMPDELSDRMQEGCEPLIAIADAAGCGAAARVALVSLFTGERPDDVESMRMRLLRDIRAIFDERDRGRLRSTTLVADLLALEEAPWAGYYGRGLEARDLSSLLAHYGVRSRSVRVGGEVAKGYKREDFHEAWARYL